MPSAIGLEPFLMILIVVLFSDIQISPKPRENETLCASSLSLFHHNGYFDGHTMFYQITIIL
uniref:Uncharacterized protein n=1 Tax=Setaria italica TaxID=4555 RepID=K4A3H1_SETIT